jgi:D-alanine-D-alanine ligase
MDGPKKLDETPRLRIAVLYNAPTLAADSAEYASESGVLESVEAFTSALRTANHDVHEIASGDSVADLLKKLERSRLDVVVNLCESFAGNSAGEPHVASLLELLRLLYTGGAPECLALIYDKARAKRLLIGGGVATPEFVEIGRNESLPDQQLRTLLAGGRVIVKPAAEDASLGIDANSICDDFDALCPQVRNVQGRYGAVLVERFIAGREFNVGIVELPELQVLPLAEIEFQKDSDVRPQIVTYDGKWSPDSVECTATPVVCPARVDASLAERISQTAVAAYRLTGCRDYARIDLRVDTTGNVFVLEINANPDAGPTAGLARMLKAAGIGYNEFVERLVQQAYRRKVASDGAKPNQTRSKSAAALCDITIRRLLKGERPQLLAMTQACNMFRPDEIEVADEILMEAERDGEAGHYRTFVAERDGQLLGWSSHGRVPQTDATFDLYWIVVAPAAQNLGIGKQLMQLVEDDVRREQGRWLLLETSSTPEYVPTRRFYERLGYHVVDEIEDFYRMGDGRVTFGKRFDRAQS